MRTIDLVYALFRHYIVPAGGEVPTAALIRLLESFDVSEDAARCAVSRLKRDGLLAGRRAGGRSYYRLTRRGEVAARLSEAKERPDPPPWDGRWWLVSYRMPGVKEAWREELQRYLAWLGYGRMAPGLYISPYGYVDLLTAKLSELGVNRWVDIYSADYLGGREPQEVARSLWDLDGLAKRYSEFLAKHEPLAQRFREMDGGRSGLRESLSFVAHVYLVDDWLTTAGEDPRLPEAMLPDHWIGARAREFYRDYASRLAKPAAGYFSEICSGGGRGISECIFRI